MSNPPSEDRRPPFGLLLPAAPAFVTFSSWLVIWFTVFIPGFYLAFFITIGCVAASWPIARDVVEWRRSLGRSKRPKLYFWSLFLVQVATVPVGYLAFIFTLVVLTRLGFKVTWS